MLAILATTHAGARSYAAMRCKGGKCYDLRAQQQKKNLHTYLANSSSSPDLPALMVPTIVGTREFPRKLLAAAQLALRKDAYPNLTNHKPSACITTRLNTHTRRQYINRHRFWPTHLHPNLLIALHRQTHLHRRFQQARALGSFLPHLAVALLALL